METNTIVDFKIALEYCKDAALSAAKFIKQELPMVQKEDIEEKALNSLVSYVDKEAEQLIVSKLRQVDIDASFITEEGTADYYDAESHFHWVIDPLDGTTNFLKGIPHFSTCISLEEKGVPVVGVVVNIMMDECFSAIKGQGARLNGKEISLLPVSGLDDAIIATGFPYANNYPLDKKLSAMQYWLLNSRGIRRMGSAALDLVNVAAGRLDAYYEGPLNRWDLSAGALIATEAGAAVCDFNGGNEFLTSGNIVASNPAIHQSVLEVIKQYLN